MSRLRLRPSVAPIVLAALLGGPRPSVAQPPLPHAVAAIRVVSPDDTHHASRPLARDTTGRPTVAGSLLHPNGSQSVALMAGGAAAVVAGALIKGTAGGALALTGTVLVFHGLYHYMARNDLQREKLHR